MGSEKLGTCSSTFMHPHPQTNVCIGWREQPQGEATRQVLKPLHPIGESQAAQDDREEAKERSVVQTEGGEKPLSDVSEWGFSGHLAVLPKVAEPSSPPATAGTLEKYFVDKTHDGWGIFYNEPNAPETGRACIGGSADEHIARLRCQILNSHIADVLDAVGFAKTQERLTGRCLCVGAWKSGCPVHDNSPATAGTAREQLVKEWMAQDKILDFSNWLIAEVEKLRQDAAQQMRQSEMCIENLEVEIMRLRTELEHEQAGVAQLRQELVKIEAEWDEDVKTLEELARENEGLRQERDALKDDWGKLSSDFRLEREARERAEKALRERDDLTKLALEHSMYRDHDYVYWCDGCNAVKRALASLKSSEGEAK